MNDSGIRRTILLVGAAQEVRAAASLGLEAIEIDANLRVVHHSEAMLDYLLCRGEYAAPGAAPQPSLILLNLHAANADTEALAAIKANAMLRKIATLVLSPSRSASTIRTCYELGASSFIALPPSSQALLTVIRDTLAYWLRTVRLPTSFGGK